MSIEYRWIIKADEIPGIPCRADTTPPVKDDRTYRNFIESSFQNGYIDANELSSILFPESEQSGRKQIFISHPHSCYEAARRVKDLLSKEYYCFVDVDVWEQVDRILSSLQRKGVDKLRLQECNNWAAHMYLLLTQAILREIAKSHIVLYIESESKDSEIIHSPWLYFELNAVQELVSAKGRMLKEANFSAVQMPVINYDINNLTKDFTRIDAELLRQIPSSFPAEIEERACLKSCIRCRHSH